MNQQGQGGKIVGLRRKPALLLLLGVLLLIAAAAFPRKRDGEWFFVGQTIRCTENAHCGPCTLGVFGIEQDGNPLDSACPR